MMNDDKIKVDVVRLAYARVVREVKRSSWVRVVMPEPGTLSFENALAFFKLSQDLSITPIDAMRIAINFFDAPWCTKVFGRSYPPFNVTTAFKTRDRIFKSCPTQVPDPGDLKAQAEAALSILRELDLPIARKMVEEGAFTQGNETIQKYLLEALV